MSTLSVKAQILSQATQLQQKLAQAKGQIDQMGPAAQIEKSQSLSQDSATLTNLQRRVTASFMRQQEAIPDVTEDELMAISEKLSQASDDLEIIEANYNLALEIFSVAMTPQIDPSMVPTLMEHNIDLLSTPHINSGNKLAIEELQRNLTAIILPQQLVPTPVIQPSHVVTHPTGSSPVVQSDQDIRAQQDEDYQASLFTDKLAELDRTFRTSGYVPNPVADFDKVLAIYKDAKAYSQSKSQFLSSTAPGSLQSTLQKAEQLMNQIIQAQVQFESSQVQQVQTQQSSSAALQGLKAAFEKMISEVDKPNADVMPLLAGVNSAFQQLSSDDKAKLLTALYDILKAANKYPADRAPPRAMLGLQFNQWHGSHQQKLEALKKIMPQTTTTPSTPQAVVAPKHADEMKRRLLEAKNAVAVPQQTRSSTSPVHTPTVQSPARTPSFDDLQIGDDAFPDNLESALAVDIRDLQSLLPLLQANASFSDLQKALEGLVMLESKGDKCTFKISSQTASLIADRPCFHLYFIHKNECPHQLVSDAKYGNNAMAGIHPATNSERQRAVQRTIVELALENLEEAVNFQDVATMAGMLNLLEEMNLTAADLPVGHNNIAHRLFGLMYSLHTQARSTSSSLTDPNDSKFKGDFGRNAFRMKDKGIDATIKLEAIKRMRDDLKAAWKV
ncbi:MAG: hypothetical protein JSS60_05020 [Verrucomicrobia bacterium]|nr:hypothetical protein [Verrucomicrobiota bacterium]